MFTVYCLENGQYKYWYDWKPVDKKGIKYVSIVDPHLTFELEKAYFNFENLFGGDKTLGIFQIYLRVNVNKL